MYKVEVIGRGNITAKIVADSVSNEEVRLTTMELRYPRFIHSEFMTHRVFSRNASSSRAIPVDKMIEQVESEPAMPIHWGKNQSGMKARESHEAPVPGIYWLTDAFAELDKVPTSKDAWLEAAHSASVIAKALSEAGYHKQIVNRLLEPFQFISVVVTATEWQNFFDLRLHPDAQPEICELARVMKEAMDDSIPRYLKSSELHLPYVRSDIQEDGLWEDSTFDYEKAAMCSVARCARVSYLNHDKSQPNIEKDIELFNILKDAKHMSPFEHVAWPMQDRFLPAGADYLLDIAVKDTHNDVVKSGITHMDASSSLWSGNFRGWLQYRQLL